MFGHQAVDQNNNQAVPPPTVDPVADNTLVQDITTVGPTMSPPLPPPPPPQEDVPSAPAVNNAAVGDYIMTEPRQVGASTNDAPVQQTTVPAHTPNDDLLNLKQQALQQLSPLVDHLDQTPEEKFRTTMMMIQASDNQSLLQSAYAAAQSITDEKTRAQALLDIVNEINYFTQQHEPAA